MNEMHEAMKRFESYLQRRYGDRSTPKHYLSDLRIFVQCIGDKPPAEVTVYDVDRFVDQQVEQEMSPATINRRLATLHTFFEFWAAEKPDQARPNPVIWHRHGVKEGTRLPRDVADVTVKRLFDAINDGRDRAIFGLMIGAGLRVGEVAALRLPDLEAPSHPDQMARLRVEGKGRKERMVWLTPSLYAMVHAWLRMRPVSESDHLFLNQHGQPLSVAGIQYRLQQHCEAAGVELSCHQLRHTFARRLAEQEMPIESLAKLLGHAQVQTTQLYTAGADPHLRDAFAQAMAQLEERPPSAPLVPEPMPHPQPEQAPRTAERRADPAQLAACLTPFDPLPSWLRDLLRAYLTWRWRNWQPHMARRHGERLAHLLSRSWEWLLTHHQLEGWADLQRSTLEAWLHARTEAGLAASTRTSELSEMLSFLRFVADQGVPLTANLFRVSYPEKPEALPRYLSEDEYRRLEQTVLAQTADDPQDPAKTQVNVRDHAWFFTLAHTGLRVSELLNLRLGDLDLAGGRLIVRSGKNTQDRLVYLTPTLIAAFHRYLPQRPSLADDHLWLDGDRPLQDHQVRHRLRCWGKSCAVAVTPHRLRHTLATRLINHGMPLESLRQLLGHQHLNMTQHYARIYDATVRDHFQAAMARMEGIAVSNWPRRETVLTTAQPEPV